VSCRLKQVISAPGDPRALWSASSPQSGRIRSRDALVLLVFLNPEDSINEMRRKEDTKKEWAGIVMLGRLVDARVFRQAARFCFFFCCRDTLRSRTSVQKWIVRFIDDQWFAFVVPRPPFNPPPFPPFFFERSVPVARTRFNINGFWTCFYDRKMYDVRDEIVSKATQHEVL